MGKTQNGRPQYGRLHWHLELDRNIRWAQKYALKRAKTYQDRPRNGSIVPVSPQLWHYMTLSILYVNEQGHHWPRYPDKYWNGNDILTKSSSLAASKVVKMTTFRAVNDENGNISVSAIIACRHDTLPHIMESHGNSWVILIFFFSRKCVWN